jgi:Resolvase, N terminal domain
VIQEFEVMLRAAGYSRVSTNRQAIEGLSIDDQLAQIEAYCLRETLAFTMHYVDRGLSGSDEDRPELQRLIVDALTKPRPFDRIIVHSGSRLFRDAAIMELTIRRLRRAGVEVIFIVQLTTCDSTSDLDQFDEHRRLASYQRKPHCGRIRTVRLIMGLIPKCNHFCPLRYRSGHVILEAAL